MKSSYNGFSWCNLAVDTQIVPLDRARTECIRLISHVVEQFLEERSANLNDANSLKENENDLFLSTT